MDRRTTSVAWRSIILSGGPGRGDEESAILKVLSPLLTLEVVAAAAFLVVVVVVEDIVQMGTLSEWNFGTAQAGQR